MTKTSHPSLLNTTRHWATKGQWRFPFEYNRETASPGKRGSLAGTSLLKVARGADRDQEGLWGRQIAPSLCSMRLSKRNDRSSKTSWGQILLSSESPGEGGWKITTLPLSCSQMGTLVPWRGQRSLGSVTSWQDTWATVFSGLLRPGSGCSLFSRLFLAGCRVLEA